MLVVAAEKRKEFVILEMEEEENATVHGMVVALSPVKQSRNNWDLKYFNGKILDGTNGFQIH